MTDAMDVLHSYKSQITAEVDLAKEEWSQHLKDRQKSVSDACAVYVYLSMSVGT